MTSIIKTNQSFESETAQPLQEGPISIIPTDIVKYILFFTNHSESTRLVSREWNILTFPAAKASNKYALEQTISLITENLNPNEHAQSIAELAEIQDAHQSLTVATCAEARRLFLINKGFVIGTFRKLPKEVRHQLQQAIGEELPDSMKDIFKISKLYFPIHTIKCRAGPYIQFNLLPGHKNLSVVPSAERAALRDKDGPKIDKDFCSQALDTIFTLLQSYQPLSKEERGYAIDHAANSKNIESIKLLLANGPISKWKRGWAVVSAARNNNPELVKLFLADGSISETHREDALDFAVKANNTELARLLVANGSISEDRRRDALLQAFENNNKEIYLLLSSTKDMLSGCALIGLCMSIAAIAIYELFSSKNT